MKQRATRVIVLRGLTHQIGSMARRHGAIAGEGKAVFDSQHIDAGVIARPGETGTGVEMDIAKGVSGCAISSADFPP